MDEGILKSFEPKIVNGKHDAYNEIYKFIVVISIGNADIRGEAGAKITSGSKAWKIGKKHEFTKSDNQYAEGGSYFKGLKCIEEDTGSKPTGSSPAFDASKDAYVTARFAHQQAIEYLKTLDEQSRKDIIGGMVKKDLENIPPEVLDEMVVDAGRKYVNKVAKAIADSVDEVAGLIMKKHEGGNK